MDVGWLLTTDEYLLGYNGYNDKGVATQVISGVVEELWNNPNRTFVFEPGYFLMKWFRIASKDEIEKIKILVNEGRIELANGGFVSNDEANSNYIDIIRQFKIWLLFIKENFDKSAMPKIGWQADEFGHSTTQAAIYSALGYDGLLMGRIDNLDRDKRRKNKNMEFIWDVNEYHLLKESTKIFTSILYDHYTSPEGFRYNEYGSDTSDVKNKYGHINQKKIEHFLNYVKTARQSFRTDHIIIPMGGDFSYLNTEKWFRNIDALINIVNEDPNFHCSYSTLGKYINSVRESKTANIPTENKILLPYRTSDHSVWTGFYTSRPNLKLLIRQASEVLHMCYIVSSNDISIPLENAIFLDENIAICQHHDAITGTSKQHVIDDYEKKLLSGIDLCGVNLGIKFQEIIPNLGKIFFCGIAGNENCFNVLRSDEFILIVFNKLLKPINLNLIIPAFSNDYEILNEENNQVKPFYFRTYKEMNSYPWNLNFVSTVPALGFSFYRIKKNMNSNSFEETYKKLEIIVRTGNNDKISIFSNKYYEVKFDHNIGNIKSIKYLTDKSSETVSLDQGFYYYESNIGDSKSYQPSGAYVFRPRKQKPLPCKGDSNDYEIIETEGELVVEIRQIFDKDCQQKIRIWKNSPFIEYVHILQANSDKGNEFISRFETDINSGEIYYTDSNGRLLQQHTLSDDQSEPVSFNYRPIVRQISIKSKNTQMSVFTERAIGGSSLKSGSIEVMLHRRTFRDDAWGMNEALNEIDKETKQPIRVEGSLWLLISHPDDHEKIFLENGDFQALNPIVMVAGGKLPNEKNIQNLTYIKNPPLKSNIRLITYERLMSSSRNEYLIRLENPQSMNNQEQSENKFNLESIFDKKIINCVKEMMIGGDRQRDSKFAINCCKCNRDELNIEIESQNIRTFLIETKS